MLVTIFSIIIILLCNQYRMIFPYKKRVYDMASRDEEDKFKEMYGKQFSIYYFIKLGAYILMMLSPIFFKYDFVTMPKLLVFLCGLILGFGHLIFHTQNINDYFMEAYYSPNIDLMVSNRFYNVYYKVVFYILSKISINPEKRACFMLNYIYLKNREYYKAFDTSPFFAEMERLAAIISLYSDDKKSKNIIKYSLNQPKIVNLVAHLSTLKNKNLAASFFSDVGSKHREKIRKELQDFNFKLLSVLNKTNDVIQKSEDSSEKIKHMQNIQHLESMYSSFDLD